MEEKRLQKYEEVDEREMNNIIRESILFENQQK